jgi:hypothetical protein
MVMNDVISAIGAWALHHAHRKTKVDELDTLKRMMEDVVRPAMDDAYKHEHNVQGYHFYEQKTEF